MGSPGLAGFRRKRPAWTIRLTLSLTLSLALVLVRCGGGGSSAAPVQRNWSAPETIAADNQLYNPVVAFDLSGNAIAAWEQTDAVNPLNVYSRRFVPGAGWDNAVDLTRAGSVGTLGAVGPHLGFDRSGNATVVWYQDDGTSRFQIWSNRYVPGTGWRGAGLVETGQGSANRPAISVAPAGDAFAVWYQQDLATTLNYIWGNRYLSGSGVWENAVRIETGNLGDAMDPDVASGPSGNAIVVWHQADAGTGFHSIRTARFTGGSPGSWGATEILQDNLSMNTDAGMPKVAMDAGGNATAVWAGSEGTRTCAWAARYLSGAGGGWQTVRNIGAAVGGDATRPMLASNPAGDVVAVWAESDGTRLQIWGNRYRAGQWGAARPVTVDNTVGNSDRPVVAVDASGNALAIWQKADANGRFHECWASYSTPDGTWDAPLRIVREDPGEVRRPYVAFDAAGNAMAVWEVNDPSMANPGKISASFYR